MNYRIRALREDLDISQTEIARYLNITQQQYSKIEMGKSEITGERLIMLAKYYNVSTDYILGLTEDRNPS